METNTSNSLKYYIECNKLISENQCGFQNQRSTTDQLIRLETAIKLAFNSKRKSDRNFIAVFIDREKAPDLLWTNGLIARLNHYGIMGRMYNFIGNFLTDLKIITRVGDTYSEEHTLENGTHKGVYSV